MSNNPSRIAHDINTSEDTRALTSLVCLSIGAMYERLHYFRNNYCAEAIADIERDYPDFFAPLKGDNPFEALFSALPSEHDGTRFLRQVFNGRTNV